MRDVNQETITGTLSWYNILLLNGFNLIRASRETEKSLSKFLEPSHRPKVVYTDNSMEFGKACEVFHGITALQHLIDSRQMTSLKEPFDE